MDESLLEVGEYTGAGYQALVDYGTWRVAILCFEEGPLPGSQTMMERHLETDEVFVLTKGNGSLIVGGNGPEVGELAVQVMEIGKIYNVKKCCWHTVLLSRDASVVIVENRDTVRENSEYVDTTGEQRRWIAEAYQSNNFNCK